MNSACLYRSGRGQLVVALVTAPLVVSLVKDKKISKKDLDEIARLIRETE